MRSLRSLEGYILIDNRHAPGVSEAQARRAGKDVVGGDGVIEASVVTCSHCQKQLIVQPLRTRERAYCRKCNHYICDECALVAHLNGGECEPYTARLDKLQEQLGRNPNLFTKG